MKKISPKIVVLALILALVKFGTSWVLSYAESTVPYGDLIPNHGYVGLLCGIVVPMDCLVKLFAPMDIF